MRTRTFAFALGISFVLAGSRIATAGQAAADSQSGPLVLTPINNRVVFSPDVKVTTVDHYTSTLVGFYAGTMLDQKFLIGGAGYWLVDPHHEAGLFYFGFLTGFRLIGTDRVGLEARVLAGGGEGTVYRTVAAYDYPDPHHRPQTVYGRYGYRDDFLLAEPQVVLDLGLTDQARINFGVGYRATTADYGYNDAFSGLTASIGVRFDLK